MATAAIAAVIGCGGTGQSTFSTNTSGGQGYDLNSRNNLNQNNSTDPNARAMAGKPGNVVPGNQILYATVTDAGTDMSQISPDSKKSETVTSYGKAIRAFAQSPTTQQVAFVTAPEAGGLGLFVNTTTSTAGATEIGDPKFKDIGSVQFTNDGKKLVFTGQIDSDPFALYVASVDGKSFKKLDEADDASLSPDGKKIAYSKVINGDSEICVRNVDGGGFKQVTKSPSEDLLPQWSKDGKKIIFTSNQGGNYGVYVTPAGGGKATKITNGEGMEYGGTFSPDNKKVAFSRIAAKPEDTGIYVSLLDGSQQTKISETPSIVGPVYWSTRAAGPGRRSSQPGALGSTMSPRAKSLLIPKGSEEKYLVKKVEPVRDPKTAGSTAAAPSTTAPTTKTPTTKGK